MTGVGGHALRPLGKHHSHLPIIVLVERRQDRGEVETLAVGRVLDKVKPVPHGELRLSPPIT
jgi:hypothetical protein